MNSRDALNLARRVAVFILKLPFKLILAVYVAVLIVIRVSYHLPRILRHPRPEPDTVSKLDDSLPPEPNQYFDHLEPYQYAPLPGDRYIRLLTIKGPARGSDAEVSYELTSVSLDNAFIGLMYRAISYTWDGQVPDRYINCSGKKLAITRNCEAILRRMRTRTRLLVWIDGICIDQLSMAEKSMQVPLMSEIYGRAYTVTVWFGDDASLGSSILFSYAWLLWCYLSLPLSERWDYFQRKIIQILARRGHDVYVRDFCRRNWWRRIWTIQELALASPAGSLGPVLAMVGDEEIPMDTLFGALLHILGFKSLALDDYPHNEMMSTQALLAHHLPRINIASGAGQPGDLDVAVMMSQSLACSSKDPRDRVYGLYGILQRHGVPLPQPSYLQSTDTVYWEFTLAACQGTQSIGIIALVSGYSALTRTPSWVPDFSQNFRAGTLAGPKRGAGGLKSRFRFSYDGCTLNAHGALVDLIKTTSTKVAWQPDPLASEVEDGPHVNLLEGYSQSVQTYRDWCKIFLQGSMNRYIEYEDLFLAFGQVLTQGMAGFANLDSKEGQMSAIVNWYRLLDPADDRAPDLEAVMDMQTVKDFFVKHPESSPLADDEEWRTLCMLKHHPVTARIHHAIWMLMRGRTFFITHTGFMGTADCVIQDQDCIFLMEGVDRPMVLRPDGPDESRWRVVCSAYIEGMMGGELWKDGLDTFEVSLI